MHRLILFAAAVAWGFACGQVRGAMIYWTDGGTIRQAELDGSNPRDVASVFATSLAYDPWKNKLYATSNPPSAGPLPVGRILRMNPDGSDMEILLTGLDAPGAIALQPPPAGENTPRRLFWTDQTSILSARMNDGGDFRAVATGLPSPFDLALTDQKGPQLYWTRQAGDEDSGAVMQSNLDGSNVKDLVGALPGPTEGIAIDAGAGMVYWTYVNPLIDSIYAGMIYRTSLDGSFTEQVVASLVAPSSMALDLESGKIYWLDRGFDGGHIARANLDGSNVEVIIDGLRSPRGLVLSLPVPEPGALLMFSAAGLALALRPAKRPRRR